MVLVTVVNDAAIRQLEQGVFPDFTRQQTTAIRSVAVGDLGLLTMGTLYTGGRPRRKQPKLSSIDFNLQTVLPLSDLNLPLRALMPANHKAFVDPSQCICLPVDSNPRSIIVPLNEMIRFCYGSSSRMLQAVLSDELPDIITEVRTDTHVAGHSYTIKTLPAGFVAADATTLAWLMHDPQALTSALYPNASIAATTPSTGPYLSRPSSRFPYAGRYRLRARGRWRQGESGSRHFLVYRIETIGLPQAFAVALTQSVGTTVTSGQAAVTRGGATHTRGSQTTLNNQLQPWPSRHPTRLAAWPAQFSGLVPTTFPFLLPSLQPSNGWPARRSVE